MGAQVEIVFPFAEIDDTQYKAYFVDGGANQAYPAAGTAGAMPHMIATDQAAPGNPLIGRAGWYYLEATVLDTGFEHTALVGFGGAAFQVQDPIGIDRHVLEPTCADGFFWCLGNSIGFGWPGAPSNVGLAGSVDNDVCAFAIDTRNHLAYAKNITQNTNWIGNGVGGADPTDPVHGNGFPFSDPANGSPITGNVYILGGCAWDHSLAGFAIPPGLPSMWTLNATGPFVGTVPAGYTAWDTISTPTVFNASTKAAQIVITGGLTLGLSAEPTGPTGNQPTGFVLSNSSKKQT